MTPRWLRWLVQPKSLQRIIRDDLYEARRLLLEAEKNVEDWLAYRKTMQDRVKRLEAIERTGGEEGWSSTVPDKDAPFYANAKGGGRAKKT